jgi:NADH-quinone oxidoreductase subunit N
MSVFHIEAGLAILGLLLLLLEAFVPSLSRRTVAYLSMAGVLVALGLFLSTCGCADAQAKLPEFVRPYFQLDGMALFYKGFALVITLLVLFLTSECAPYLSRYAVGGKMTEMFSLPLIICAGMMWMAAATDLLTLFVTLELVTVSFYVLVAFTRKSSLALEAGVKYLILGALSTGILVYGMAWLYGCTGTLKLSEIAQALSADTLPKGPTLFAAAFLLSGLAFKVAAAPFQVWVPDVYQGAPIPVTTYLSVGSKASGFVVLSRMVEVFVTPGSRIAAETQGLLLVLGGLTILLGSLPAIHQCSVKRLLGFSSISHAGFLLIALACRTGTSTLEPTGIVAFYLATYLPMTVLGFLVLAIMRLNEQGEDMQDFRGLAQRSPLLALVMTLALASLAGLPLTAGFMGKLFVFISLVKAQNWAVLALAAIGAAAGFYYYFRAIFSIYTPGPLAAGSSEPLRISPASKLLAAGLGVVIVVLGVYPLPLQRLLTPNAQVAHTQKANH